MTTITLELPEDLAAKAKEAGLLSPERSAELIDRLLRIEAMDRFLAWGDKLRAANGGPVLTEEEILAEVKAVRAERRAEQRKTP